MSPTTATAIIVIGFLLGLTGMGAWFARRIKTDEDFALAGRGLTAPILVGTLVATWTGTGSLFANAEFTVSHGVAGYWLPLSSGLGIMILAFLAPRARALPAQTVPQILGVRFGGTAQRLGAVALILSYLIIVSYQFRAGAAFTMPVFGIEEGYRPWVIVGFAFFVILFTALAGMFSVAFTDVVCGVVMLAGVLIACALVINDFSGNPQISLPEAQTDPSGGLSGVRWIGIMLPTFLLILGDANMHQRFLSAESTGAARWAAVGMFFGVLVIDAAIITVALFGSTLLGDGLDNPRNAIVEVAFEILPWGLGVVITCTAFAVIISTADSFLLASATSAAGDLFEAGRRPLWQRIIVVVLGGAALWLAFLSDAYFDVALYAYTLYGASLTPALLLALLRPLTPAAVVIAGIVAGLSTTLLWKLALWLRWLDDVYVLGEPLGELDAVIPAMAANVLAMLVAAMIAWLRR